MPDEAKNRVIPGLCRMGLETTAHEVYSTRSYAAGLDRLTVEKQMGRHLNRPAEIGIGAALRQDRPDRCVAQVWKPAVCRLPALQQGVHAGSTSDHADDVNAVRTAVKDLRQTVT